MRCLGQAFQKVTSHTFPSEISAAGKTDPLIIREAFRAVNFPKRDWVETEQRILRKYPRYLERNDEELVAVSLLLEGVRPLLEYLRRRDYPMALLTGNMEITARRKLDVFGLNEFFPVGGFGSDCADRNRLGRVALERACRHYERRFETRDVWIIGDTPRDIEAANALGAKALAVATGPYRTAFLEEFLPTVAFENLASVGDIVKALEQRR